MTQSFRVRMLSHVYHKWKGTSCFFISTAFTTNQHEPTHWQLGESWCDPFIMHVQALPQSCSCIALSTRSSPSSIYSIFSAVVQTHTIKSAAMQPKRTCDGHVVVLPRSRSHCWCPDPTQSIAHCCTTHVRTHPKKCCSSFDVLVNQSTKYYLSIGVG